MSVSFDPYYTWLAIPPEEQPPHHYRLLGVKPLEENLDVIENAADQRMKHLRDYQSGKHGQLSQKLLNEVASARVVLLDPAKKSAYDAELRAKLNLLKQAELKKARAERPLAIAQPLAAKPAGEWGAGSGEREKVAAPQFSAAISGAKPRGSNNAMLLIAAGVVVLLLLVGGGIAAMMFLRDDEPVVAVAEANDEPADDEPPATTTNPPPVVPPVIPPPIDDDPPATDPAPPIPPVDPPAEEPVAENPIAPDDEPLDEVPAAEEVAVAEEPAAPAKLSVPEKAEREAKRKEILAIFPVAQARTFEQKGQYAAQLLRTAGETVDDPAAVFAMLNLAREQAAEAGQIKLALEATDMLGETFDFDASAVRIASLQQASRAQLPPAAKRDIVIAGMDVIDELSAADKFDEADALSDRMLTLARPLRDAELIKSLADQRRTFTEAAASFKKAKTAFETLKTSPDDADANLAAGKYLTIVKQDWEAGLAHLAKGGHAPLAAAAKAEIAAPKSPADQEKLADAWWAAAESQKDSATKEACRSQAGYWYREIVGKLSGLAKVKVEKRISELGHAIGILHPRDKRSGRLESVYLDDLSEIDAKVHFGSLGKHCNDFAGRPTTFEGQKFSHGLETHAAKDGTVHVTYKLDGSFETFQALVGVRGSKPPLTPVTFRVVGDEKILWQSAPIQDHDTGHACRVKIQGVRVLSLQVLCPGDNYAAWSVWINPRVSRFASSTPRREPDLGIFSRDPAELDSPPAEEFVYLDDLTETASEIGYGSLGKHGSDGAGGKVIFTGEPRTHSLAVHATESGAVYVTYRLGKKYDTFQATAGLRESPSGKRGVSMSPLTFSVIGDKKVLWKSRAIKQHGDGEPCRVSVRGVDVLTLQVASPGPAGQAWSIWVDPRLTPVGRTGQEKPDPAKIDPRNEAASAPENAGSVICKVLEGKRQPIELAEGAIAFGGPRGDGRVGANGFVVDAPEAWKKTGTIWSCSYRRGGSANGIHFIHPLGAGHAIVTVTTAGVAAASVPAWPDRGYTGGTGSIPLTTVPNFAEVVQLAEEPHQLTSAVAANGEFAFYIDGKLLAAGRFTDAVAIDLGAGFSGEGFAPALRAGQAGVIMGPLDNGINRADDVRLAVIENKKK